MLSLLLAAATPPTLTPTHQQQLRCVAVLAIVAGEQERRTAAALELPPLVRDGARFAQVVGEAMVRDTGRSQEQVRQLILAEVAAVQKQAGADAKLPVEEARGCAGLAAQVAPAPPPPSAVQCAGLLKLAADDVRRREGMSKSATDLITLSSVIENRARTELRAQGKTEAQGDRELGLARDSIRKRPEGAPDMEACVELAKP